MIKLELRLHKCNLFPDRKGLSSAFYQIADKMLRSGTIKVSEIRRLHAAIANRSEQEHFPHIVGRCCVNLKSAVLGKLPTELLSNFPCFNLYRAKVNELKSDRRGRFLALKQFYLTEPFVSCPEFHDYRHNYAVFVNDALYYHDLEAVVYQNETVSRFVSRRDFNFLINESIFLCQKLKIFVPGYQESAFMRSLDGYVNDLAISTVEGEVIHLDTRNNLQVKVGSKICRLPYYEHSCQPPYLQLLLLGQRMKFVMVDRNTVSMRRYRNIHCAKLNARIQKGEPLEGVIISKNLMNLVLDLGYGIRASLSIESRYQKVLIKQFQVGDTVLVRGVQSIDAFYMNRVEGFRFFSQNLQIRMVVGIILKFVRKGYKSFIAVALGINEFVSVECEPTSHIYYGPGHYVILKRDEGGNYSLYKPLWKQYISFSYGPKADVATIFGDCYQYYISFDYSENIPPDELIEIEPVCSYPLVPGNLLYCVIKSLGPVPSVVLPDFIGRPVNEGIDFCKKQRLDSPRVEYIPIEEPTLDENYILEMHPEPNTAVQLGHQVLFVVPKREVSPFQVFYNEQMNTSSTTLSISRYLNINMVFDEQWKLLVLEFFVNHLCANRFQLSYYLRLYQFEKDKPLDKLIDHCLSYNILIQCDIQNEHRRSVRTYTLNPNIAKKCRQMVGDRVISRNTNYIQWDSVSIKATLSTNQAYLYLLTQYKNVPNVRYYSEFAQYIKPATAEKGFVKIHLCCILPSQTILIFESVRDYTKTKYLRKNRLHYPEEYINKILRLDEFFAERSPRRPCKAIMYLLCETMNQQERLQNEISRDPRIQSLRHIQLRYTNDIDTNLNKINLQWNLFPQIDMDLEESKDDI